MADYRQELEEYQQLHEQAKALEETVNASPVRDLVGLMKRGGKMKGELPGITPAQFRKLTGHAPAKGNVRKVQGGTTENVPWELALDGIATERGYKSGEALREAIYKTRDDMDKLEDLKQSQRVIGANLKQAGKETELQKLEAKVEKTTGKPPVFGKDETKAEKVIIDGMTIVRTRQYPFWQVEVDTDGQPPPEQTLRVRYAADAKKLIRAATKDREEELNREAREIKRFKPISGRAQRLTPKTPRLR